jgi:hypothetical protein
LKKARWWADGAGDFTGSQQAGSAVQETTLEGGGVSSSVMLSRNAESFIELEVRKPTLRGLADERDRLQFNDLLRGST